MAEERRTHECYVPVVREEGREGIEVKERGIFGEEKERRHDHHHHHGEGVKEEVIAAEFKEKANICEEEKLKGDEGVSKEKKEKKKEKKEKKKKDKLGRSDSSSSSSSDEEEDEEKKKKKKEKKERKEREKREKKEKEEKKEGIGHEETAVPVEKCDEEKKGFLEKIKEKIPVVGGQAKKAEEAAPPAQPPPPTLPPSDCDVAAVEAHPPCKEGEANGKEKKGLLEKIKEKLPGYHPKSHEEGKEKEKEKEKEESACT